ncbi:exonuclease SbcC [Vibrio maritimus]|uniref:Nuclease SbcCD subunit C n=1 Tax=Vibrio maritimus TaxID=990268 RepID=A0A090RRN6_9VIBR|nr:exonuclease SbcC [Vibrio maritimus]
MLKKKKAQLNELTLALDLETKKKQSLLSLSSIEASLQESLKQKAILMSSLSAQETEVKLAQQTRTEAEIQWHTGQAALLAASLENGLPCPVCGSLDHPKVAESVEKAVTLDQVNKLRDQEARANEALAGYKQKQTELESQLTSLSDKKQDTLSSLGIESTELPRFAETVNRNITELTSQIAKFQAIDLDNLERQLKQSSDKRVQLQAKFEQQATLIADATNVMQHLQGVVSSLTQSNNTGFDNAQAVVARQQVLESDIAQKAKALEQSQESLNQASEMLAKFESHLETLQKDLDEREKERINAQSRWQSQLSSSPFTDENAFLNAKLVDAQAEELSQRIEQYQHDGIRIKEQLNLISAQIGEQTLPDVERLKLVKSQMEETYQSALKQFQMHQSQFNNLTQVRKRIDALREQNEELDKQYQVVGTLSDVANGRTGNKISLHRFVLGVLLDDVLIQASQRLRLMSKGRYDLKRKEARTKGNAGSGLDLIVEDAYTGKWRDVATLSGGESFMAALSLALGLSDVVQSYSGGIRLDTLFIDEGFGSLDPESLDLAVQTLVELQQSGRTIGIISHVSELKEQMPLRLDVHASRVGSTVSLVN